MPEIYLPTFHPGQVSAFWKPGRFKAIRCGRRWGKTDFGKVIACDGVIKSQRIGWFAPDHKIMSEAYDEIADMLDPIKQSSSKQAGLWRATTGGRIDYWTLNNKRAGRSRKYHKILIDEAAFTEDDMMDIWEKSIKPTLLDYGGSCIAMSNTNGVSRDNFFWRICNEPEHGFVEYHAPTIENPYMPAAEIVRLKETTHPMVFAQEYGAEFIDWSGVAIFSEKSMLVDGQPVDYPNKCDYVFAVVDTAAKDGAKHDGTAVTWFARNLYTGIPLIILDYDIIQIPGDLLENWLPSVERRGLELAAVCGARQGYAGTWVEDKMTGIVLNQQAQRAGLNVAPIDTKLTALGKEARAMAVSGYVYQGLVKFSRFAYDKVITFKNATRNHLLTQVCGFRVGEKMQHDDALDTFTYGVAISLGDGEGW
jgi:hypothetical protein